MDNGASHHWTVVQSHKFVFISKIWTEWLRVCYKNVPTSKYAIFSMAQSARTPRELNISIPFCASLHASRDGVKTETTPLSWISWQIVSWTSPVPGGKSTIKTSRCPQSVPFNLNDFFQSHKLNHIQATLFIKSHFTYSCVTTLLAMGPRMTAAPPLWPDPGTPLCNSFENDIMCEGKHDHDNYNSLRLAIQIQWRSS